MTKLFLYGTLRDPDVFKTVCLRELAGRPAVLPDYKAVFARGEVYPTLIVSPGDQTQGLLTEVDEFALRRILFFEEVGETYELGETNVLESHTGGYGELGKAKCFMPLALAASDQIWGLEIWSLEHKKNFLKDAAKFMLNFR